MRTQTKINNKLRRKIAKLWADSEGITYTTDEVLTILRRIRAFYLSLWQSQLEDGDIELNAFCKAMTEDLTALFSKIENERAQADVEVAKTITRYPLMLAPAEAVDFAHILDGEALKIDDNDSGPTA